MTRYFVFSTLIALGIGSVVFGWLGMGEVATFVALGFLLIAAGIGWTIVQSIGDEGKKLFADVTEQKERKEIEAKYWKAISDGHEQQKTISALQKRLATIEAPKANADANAS